MPKETHMLNSEKFQVKTAILVDGGFYRKRSTQLLGYKTPVDRANELHDYCHQHLRDNLEHRQLYRVFYYDCPPSTKNVYNPLTQRTINLGKTDEFKWANEFYSELKHLRKFALRLGSLNENEIYYNLKVDRFKKLMRGEISVEDLTDNDLDLHIEQKGVDMRIGVDIASLSFKHQVDQIILISGDSDFVPAAKLARREGIDFVLDPMRSPIRPDLYEHIDGIRTPYSLPKFNEQ